MLDVIEVESNRQIRRVDTYLHTQRPNDLGQLNLTSDTGTCVHVEGWAK
jgi:hypothetical protein